MRKSYKDINKDELYDLYTNQGYTQAQCAEILGVNEWNVKTAMEKYDIPVRSFTEIRSSKLIISMTTEMYEVLYGALLGDGALYINKKKGVNARFSYTSKSFQHVKYIYEYFSEYSQSGIKRSDRFDKRTDKTYISYAFNTKVSPTLTSEYNKWYYDGKKHIPNDLKLTPLTCKVWYIGDGCLTKCSKIGTSQTIYLCTNCFPKEEIENILLPQLAAFNPYLSKTENEGQYRIGIGNKKYIKKFLEYIGECPFEDYQYKWDVVEARKGCNGETAFCNDLNEWIFLYNSGLSFVQIGALYGCTRGAVEPQLYRINEVIRHRGDPIPNDYKKWDIIYSEPNEIKKIPEEYKRNAIKKYIEYISTHKEWPTQKDKLKDIIG